MRSYLQGEKTQKCELHSARQKTLPTQNALYINKERKKIKNKKLDRYLLTRGFVCGRNKHSTFIGLAYQGKDIRDTSVESPNTMLVIEDLHILTMNILC
jgi:hypothetical protein